MSGQWHKMDFSRWQSGTGIEETITVSYFLPDDFIWDSENEHYSSWLAAYERHSSWLAAYEHPGFESAVPFSSWREEYETHRRIDAVEAQKIREEWQHYHERFTPWFRVQLISEQQRIDSELRDTNEKIAALWLLLTRVNDCTYMAQTEYIHSFVEEKVLPKQSELADRATVLNQRRKKCQEYLDTFCKDS